MHLGIDARTLCESHPTGISRYAFHIVNALLKEQPELKCSFFISGLRAHRKAKKLRETFPSNRVHIRAIRIPNKLFRLGSCLGIISIDRLVRKPDMWFFPGPKPARIANKPYVLTVHDLANELYPDLFSWNRRMSARTERLRRLCKRATHIITVSNHTAHDLETLYHIPASKITSIFPGIDQLEKTRRTPEAKHLLMVSSIEPRKNMEAVVRAIGLLRTKNEFKDLRLTIIGPPGWKTKRMIRAMEHLAWVNVKGFVSDEELDQAYNQATVFLYPSFYEGFGFPPLEAMARGVPVIASHVSSLPEVLGDAAVYVDPYDWQGLAQTVEEVLQDKDLQAKLTNRGFAQVQQFTWEACAQKTADVLMKTYESGN